MKQPKILFFTAGAMPTVQDRVLAADIGVVNYRNARKINAEDKLEDADGVAGPAIPPQYRNAYPSADRAIKEHKAAMRELAKSVGGELPPQLPHNGMTEGEHAAHLQAKADASTATGTPAVTDTGTTPADGIQNPPGVGQAKSWGQQ